MHPITIQMIVHHSLSRFRPLQNRGKGTSIGLGPIHHDTDGCAPFSPMGRVSCNDVNGRLSLRAAVNEPAIEKSIFVVLLNGSLRHLIRSDVIGAGASSR
jgi:hypothetical protein